ncbi:right-handed parallel beta-helix repeat-containing protein [Halostagnicola bangensis]
MSEHGIHRTTDSNRTSTPGAGVSRRHVLATIGVGTGTTLGLIGSVRADDHEATVWEDGGTWYADNAGDPVYDGPSMRAAIQAGVDSLSDGRTSMETVVVMDSGTFGPTDSLEAVDLPSFTELDLRGTIFVEDTGEDLVVPIRARSAESIAVPGLQIEGNPRYGVWIQSCSDVFLGQIGMDLSETTDLGLGIRIDDADGGRSTNVTLESATIAGAAHHAVETYGVDGIEIGSVETFDTGGCGLLLNDTSDAIVDSVDAFRADAGGGYAAFRFANGAGPNIHVGEVTSVESGRGVFGVSGSYGVTIENLDVYESGQHGVLIQDCQDVLVDGGLVRNNGAEGVRIDSRDDGQHHPAEDVTVQNLRVVDDRDDPQQPYGIRETGPDTSDNEILDNDVRDGGTTAELEVYSSSTVVEGNITS